jgi:hypothetical protein
LQPDVMVGNSPRCCRRRVRFQSSSSVYPIPWAAIL